MLGVFSFSSPTVHLLVNNSSKLPQRYCFHDILFSFFLPSHMLVYRVASCRIFFAVFVMHPAEYALWFHYGCIMQNMLCGFVITGNGKGMESNGDNVCNSVHAYGGKGRGRGRVHSFRRQGRGYGAEAMQKESVGYDELSASEAPPRLWRGKIICSWNFY